MKVNSKHSPDQTYSNTLINPLVNFHGKVISILFATPQQKGILIENAKKIIIVVAALFIYPLLSLLAFLGIGYSICFQRKNKDPNQELNQNSKQKISDSIQTTPNKKTKSDWDEVKNKIIFQVKSINEIEKITSIKMFIDISLNGKTYSCDSIMKILNLNLNDFLLSEINKIFENAKKDLNCQPNDKLKFQWEALLKDENNEFHNFNGSRYSEFKNGSSHDNSAHSNSKISAEDRNEFFELVLTSMNRVLQPQLDANGDFI